MVVDALITAGGKGTRMRELGMEKPMVPLLGRPLVEYVLDAVLSSTSIGKTHVSVSDNAPLTRAHLAGLDVELIETSGDEYCKDLNRSMECIDTDQVFICPVDMPLLTSGAINEIVERYFLSGYGSLSVAVPLDVLIEVGSRPSYCFNVDGEEVALCGISVVDRNQMLSVPSLTEGYMVFRSPDLALNVNTIDDLMVAEQVLKTRSAPFSQ